MSDRAATERETLLLARDLGGYLRVGVVWVNDHTAEETTITGLRSRVERLPVAAGGFSDVQELVVDHTVNVPPGFRTGYGDELASFLAHWQPKEVRRNV